MNESNTSIRTFVLMIALGLALGGTVVVSTAEPAEALYVDAEIEHQSGSVTIIVCTGSPERPGFCI